MCVGEREGGQLVQLVQGDVLGKLLLQQLDVVDAIGLLVGEEKQPVELEDFLLMQQEAGVEDWLLMGVWGLIGL